MAALHDLVPALAAAAHRDLSAPGRKLGRQDVAGIAVLLGLAAELLADGRFATAPVDADADPTALLLDATRCLEQVRRVVEGGAES